MRLSTWLILVPATVIAAALAVANRDRVAVSLDPFSRETPALVLDLPLYGVIMGSLLIGLILGALVMWVSQGRHRNATRELRAMSREIAAARAARPAE
ncbi:MAG: DUF1049 domain-containing protein [Alphaproteobacteria bacterium]|nr:DUF1049 domain-containing protein [Alphaproteobacteria bacterium]